MKARRFRVPLTALLTLAGCVLPGSATVEEDQFRSRVKVAEVSAHDVEHTLELTGTVEAGRSVHLLPTAPGKIKKLDVKVGDKVTEGQVLARMDLDVAMLQLEQTRAALRLAELGVGTATNDYGRAQTLHERGTLTPQQHEQAQAGMEMAELQRAQANAALGLAREQVSGGVLKAPFDGIVSVVGGEQGDFYNPMTASPLAGPGGLVGVVDLDTVRMDLHVTDRDIVKLKAGMAAHIRVAAVADLLPDEGLPATIESVGVAADPTTRTFPVRVVADNPEHVVRAGIHGTAQLVVERRDEVIAVPRASVLDGVDGPYVIAVDGGIGSRISVEVGLVGVEWTEILDGLEGGEQIAVEGAFGLPDGALVEVQQ